MSGHNHNQADRAACGEPAPYGSDVCERPPYHPGEHTRAGHSWTRGVVVSGDQLNQADQPVGPHEPQVWCPNREQHDPHWHTVRAGGITYAGGWCRGEARGEVSP